MTCLSFLWSEIRGRHTQVVLLKKLQKVLDPFPQFLLPLLVCVRPNDVLVPPGKLHIEVPKQYNAIVLAAIPQDLPKSLK